MNFENFPEDIQEKIIDKYFDAVEQDINLLEKRFKTRNTYCDMLETKALCLKNKILSLEHSLKLYDMHYKDFEHEVVNNLHEKSILSYMHVFEENDFYKSKIVIEHYTKYIEDTIEFIERCYEGHLYLISINEKITISPEFKDDVKVGYKLLFFYHDEYLLNSVLIGETILKLENAQVEFRYLMDTIHDIYRNEKRNREIEENPHEYDGIIW